MTDKPNILHFFCDQLRFDMIGALNNPVIKTPNLDRLAREGTAFTSAYTASPECVPARASMIFGQYPSSTKCYSNGTPMALDEKETMMGALGRAGYYCHGIGKCHFAPSSKSYELNGFDSRESQEEMTGKPERDTYMQYLWDQGFDYITDPHGVRGDMYYVPQPAQMSAEHHPTQWVGDRSAAFIESKKDSDQPWYLFSSFIHPHPPFCPPAPWHKLYRDMDVPMPHMPLGYENLLIFINHFQNRYKRRDRGFDLQLVRMMRAYYFACVSFIDYQVGRILDALEAAGQLDNTMILFTADHGELLGDFGSFGKRSYHDAPSRIPMLVRYPGHVEAGAICETPVGLVDVTKTILDAADAQIDTHALEGDNMLEIAKGADPDRVVFSQLNKGGDAIYTAVSRRWKYVYSAPDQRELLFDRLQDPTETRDLANRTWDRRFPSVRAQEEMRNCLIQMLKDTGEEAAIEGDGWKEYPKKSLPANPDAGMLYQDHPWADQSIPGYTEPRE
ncbi:MAG: sulfatase [Candidatus Sumerlaeota bacterium]